MRTCDSVGQNRCRMQGINFVLFEAVAVQDA